MPSSSARLLAITSRSSVIDAVSSSATGGAAVSSAAPAAVPGLGRGARRERFQAGQSANVSAAATPRPVASRGPPGCAGVVGPVAAVVLGGSHRRGPPVIRPPPRAPGRGRARARGTPRRRQSIARCSRFAEFSSDLDRDLVRAGGCAAIGRRRCHGARGRVTPTAFPGFPGHSCKLTATLEF